MSINVFCDQEVPLLDSPFLSGGRAGLSGRAPGVGPPTAPYPFTVRSWACLEGPPVGAITDILIRTFVQLKQPRSRIGAFPPLQTRGTFFACRNRSWSRQHHATAALSHPPPVRTIFCGFVLSIEIAIAVAGRRRRALDSNPPAKRLTVGDGCLAPGSAFRLWGI